MGWPSVDVYMELVDLTRRLLESASDPEGPSDLRALMLQAL